MQIVAGNSFTIPVPESPRTAKQMEMMWIPPGKFLMGDPDYHPVRKWENGRQFEATISEGFWFGKYPLTQAQWQAISGKVHSMSEPVGDDYPVNNVNWSEAVQFCLMMNLQYGRMLPPPYKFHLTSEVQWEYICQSDFRLVNKEALSDLAWHKGNSGDQLHSVGEKLPTSYGIHDLVGNIWEWCLDVAGDYPENAATDWLATGDISETHCIRGGGYGAPITDSSFDCIARSFGAHDVNRPWIGFRLCISTLNVQFNTE